MSNPFSGGDENFPCTPSTTNPPLPRSTSTKSKTSQNHDVTRDAPQTGTTAPKDPVRIDGTFKGGK
jgi:hypothetical protein